MKTRSMPSLKKSAVLAALAAAICAGPLHAQSKGMVAKAKQEQVPYFKSPSDAQPAGNLAASSFPSPILDETKDGLLLVNVGGKQVWVDSMDVIANRNSANRCSQGVGAKSTAAHPGAADNLCQ